MDRAASECARRQRSPRFSGLDHVSDLRESPVRGFEWLRVDWPLSWCSAPVRSLACSGPLYVDIICLAQNHAATPPHSHAHGQENLWGTCATSPPQHARCARDGHVYSVCGKAMGPQGCSRSGGRRKQHEPSALSMCCQDAAQRARVITGRLQRAYEGLCVDLAHVTVSEERREHVGKPASLPAGHPRRFHQLRWYRLDNDR